MTSSRRLRVGFRGVTLRRSRRPHCPADDTEALGRRILAEVDPDQGISNSPLGLKLSGPGDRKSQGARGPQQPSLAAREI
jgi:hypothetical protein